jgi:hypothetical protein
LGSSDGVNGYLGIEAQVSILEGPGVPAQSIKLFRAMQAGMPLKTPGNLMWNGKEISPDEFRRAMVDERRVIYEFASIRVCGLN